MCNLIEYNNNYLKTPGSLWQYYRNEPSSDNNDNVVGFSGANYKTKFFKNQQGTHRSTGCYQQKKC